MISVIIPTFNRNAQCKRAIESVLIQSVPCEIIIVDDGSEEPIQFSGETGIHIIKFVRLHDNRGVSAARNRGVRESSNNILCFLDSDDVWLPNKLEQQIKAYQKTGGKSGTVIIGQDSAPDKENGSLPVTK